MQFDGSYYVLVLHLLKWIKCLMFTSTGVSNCLIMEHLLITLASCRAIKPVTHSPPNEY